MAWRDLDIGAVSAYAIAVEHGYTGTEEEWASEQAAAGENARIAKKSAESAKSSEQNVIKALESIEEASTNLIEAIEIAGETQISNVQSEGATQTSSVKDAGNEQSRALSAQGDVEQRKVIAAGDEQVSRVTNVGNGAVESVTLEKTNAVNDVQSTKNEAINSVEAAKTSAVEAVKSAESAAIQNIGTGVDDTLSISGKAADAKKTGDSISSLKDDLAAETRRAKDAENNRIKKFYTGNLGATSIADSDDGAVRNLVIGGNCVQGDNPSLDHSQEIKCVENCTITMSRVDGTKSQDASIPFTLRAIGNVRDELYVYADGTGKLVQRVKMQNIQNDTDWNIQQQQGEYALGYQGDKVYDGIPTSYPDCATYMSVYGNSSDTWSNKFSFGKTGVFWIVPYTNNGNLTSDDINAWLTEHPLDIFYPLKTPIETLLTSEQVKSLFDLCTYYGGTNVTFDSENGVEPTVNFDYACSLESFVEYIKAEQGNTRDFIYDMDERTTDAEYIAALAYVNSEYAAALTELEV